MLAISPRVVVTTFAGTLALAAALPGPQATARAADASPAAARPVRAAAPRVANARHAATPVHPLSAAPPSLFACNPGDDLACTVIHETANGIVVVTFRPKTVKSPPEWSVVNAPSDINNAGAPGGTIYVVPNGGRQLTVAHATNDAPIID